MLIQHNSDNIERLSNFVNYQRLDKNMRGLPLINQSFGEQSSHQEKNSYKLFTFSMVKFDPQSQVVGEKKSGIVRVKQKAATIFSEIFLTEKSSYFMMRTQMVNCMC